MTACNRLHVCETGRRHRALATRTCARGTVDHWKHRGGLCAWHLAESCKRRNRERSVQSACGRGLRRCWLVLWSCSVWYSPVQDSEPRILASLHPSLRTAQHGIAKALLSPLCTCTTFVCEQSANELPLYLCRLSLHRRSGFGWQKTHKNSSVRGSSVLRARGVNYLKTDETRFEHNKIHDEQKWLDLTDIYKV